MILLYGCLHYMHHIDLCLHSPYERTPYTRLGNRYEGEGNELCGGDEYDTDETEHYFEIVEYEVFVLE